LRPQPQAICGLVRTTSLARTDERLSCRKVVRDSALGANTHLLIDDPDGEDERTLMRLMRSVPAAGDLIDVDGENVLVTTVSRIPARKKTAAGVSVSVLVYCRQP